VERAPDSTRTEPSAVAKAVPASGSAASVDDGKQPAAATLYRWVDKDGAVHFGPTPPPEFAKTAVPVVDVN
jgi:hypothetical protein